MVFSTRAAAVAITALVAAAATSVVANEAACQVVPSYSQCGSSNYLGICCPSGQYCQPWNADYWQCIPTPPKCTGQVSNRDFPGNDIKTVYVNHPNLCCDACTNTPGCVAYTYVNFPGEPACYLKYTTGVSTVTPFAVSGFVDR